MAEPISWQIKNLKLFKCAGLCLCLLLASDYVMASPTSDGLQAFRGGDEHLAESYWRVPAEKGNYQAQFYLSVLYGNGKGALEDQSLSIIWLRQSADFGFAPAQFNLGNHYFQGRWVAQNHQTARYWWLLAAEQGWEGAQYNLGNIYYRGIGVVRNRGQAEYWLKLAAASGSQPAKNILLEMSVEGVALPKEQGMQATALGKTSSRVSGLDLGTQWVMSQPKHYRTVQLLATTDLPQCAREAKEVRQLVKLELVTYRYRVKGALYCALLVGSYASDESAQAAVARLPESLKKGKPWVRWFKSLQKRAL